MFTIKRKLIVLIAGVLAVALGSLALVLISSERARITADITTNALHFAEFSADSIAELYDLYYRSQSYALFDSELQKILNRNVAITRIELATAEGKLLFSSGAKPNQSLPLITDSHLLARLKINRTSLATSERTVYLGEAKHAAAGVLGYRAEDAEGRASDALSSGDEVTTIIYPLKDNLRRAIFHTSYDEVSGRVTTSIGYLAALFFFGFGVSFLIATRFANTITAPLAALRAGAKRIASGNLAEKIQVQTNDETKELADTFNQMTTELAAAVETKINYERTARELELASEIQTSILPKKSVVPGLELAVHFSPASEVGGDVYDFLTVDEERSVFYLGDVTGHGVPAGMIAALTNAIIATAVTATFDLVAILKQTNQILHLKTKPNMFMTLLLFGWNQAEKVLTYANAGHEPVLIYRARTRTVELGTSGSLGLGMLSTLRPEPIASTVRLERDDVLLTFTDGIIEAQNTRNEMLAIPGLQKLFQTICEQTTDLQMIQKMLLERAAEFREGVPPADDITLILAKVAG